MNIKFKLRISIEFMTLSFLILISTSNCFSQSELIKAYEDKINKLDTSVYFNVQLHKTRYLTGGLNFLAISASRYYQNEKISTFIDTNRTFHRNGNLKHMQIQDSIGLVYEIYQYDKSGQITRHCQISRDILPNSANSYADLRDSYENYCKKYKNGKLIFEGKFIGAKTEDGKHIWYDSDGKIKKEVIFDKGMIINNTQQ